MNEITPAVADGGGLRFNEGKLARYDLVPADAIHELAIHYGRGAVKYGDGNWLRGMAWGHCFASAMRHAWKFWMGERYDPELGTHHMIAAAWNFIALFVYDMRQLGEDNRPIIVHIEKDVA